jgi:zinc protease
VSLDLLARNAKPGVDLVADLLRNSTFPSDEVDRQRNLFTSGLKSLLEDPGSLVDRAEVASTFRGHPYGNQPTLATLAAITREDILACARQNLAPERMIIVCVGAMSYQDQTQLFKSAFETWPRGKETLTPPPAVKPATRRFVVVDKPDATQAQVRWSIITPPGNRPDRLASRVASAILGGGFTSRLVDEIRVKRSLTYSIGSRFSGMERAGMFEVRTFTKTSTIKEIMDATEAILLDTATNGFTQAELIKIKGYMSGQFASQMQTSSALASRLADLTLYGFPADELQTYLTKLNALTLAEVNQAARRYIGPQNLNVTVVAPVRDMEKAYKGRGKAEVIPAEKTIE